MAVKQERIVYGIVSLWAMRVHWALHELGLDYRTEPIESRSGQTQAPDYLKLNPRQKIPVLKDGDFVMTESAAIVTYLGERYGNDELQLVPGDIKERARYFEWLSFITMELDATSLYVLRRHEGLAEIYGDAPAATASARAYFAKLIDAAAEEIDDGRDYLLGSTFSGADIVMGTCLDWAIRYRVPLPDVFLDYRERLIARPAYAAASIANRSPEVSAP